MVFQLNQWGLKFKSSFFTFIKNQSKPIDFNSIHLCSLWKSSSTNENLSFVILDEKLKISPRNWPLYLNLHNDPLWFDFFTLIQIWKFMNMLKWQPLDCEVTILPWLLLNDLFTLKFGFDVDCKVKCLNLQE